MPKIEIKGLRGLNDLTLEERELWRKQNAAKLKGKGITYEDKLYANQQFANKYGMEAFHTYNKAQRDEIFRRDLVQDAFDKRYSNESNYDVLNHLTTDGKIALFDKGFSTEAELEEQRKKMNESAKAVTDDNSTWGRIGNELYAANLDMHGIPYGSAANPAPGSGVPTQRQQDLQSAVDSFEEGVMKGHRQTLDTIIAEDNRRKMDSVGDASSALKANWQQAIDENKTVDLGNGKTQTYTQYINDMFDKIAGGSEETVNDGFGERKVTTPGSRYYRAFKDSSELENLSLSDKMDFLSNYLAIANQYGEADAYMALETQMQDYVSDNQSGWTWAGQTLKNIWTGGVANIMNKVMGLEAIAYAGDKEEMANFLEGKNADGSSRAWYNNPKYWEGVDQFNTFDADEIRRAEENGGISQFQNITRAGEERGGWATMNEALKMTKFIWSDYLVGRVLGAAGKQATRGTAALFGKTATWGVNGELLASSGRAASAMNKMAAYSNVAMSGVGIAESYGMQTYNQTLQEANQLIDAQIDKEASEYAQSIINTPEGQAEIEAYVQREVANRKAQQAEYAKTHEGASSLPINEDEIRRQGTALYTEVLAQRYKEDPNNSHSDDREYARRKAADAYMVDATIEELRMAAGNFAWKKYLFGKNTRAALGDNNPFLGNLESDAQGMLSSTANKTWQTTKKVLTPVWDGFQSNYLDDVTVGFGKGFGLGEFNNYLAFKYNPEKAIASSNDFIGQFISGLEYGMKGAKEASMSGQSFYDGFVGALGSITSFSPRITSNERQQALDAMGVKKGDNLTFGQKFNKWVMNPLVNNYYEAQGQASQAPEFLDLANATIAKKGAALQDVANIVSALNMKEASIGKGSDRLKAKNAKANQALQLVTLLDNWSKDPILSQSKLVQEAQATLESLAEGTMEEEQMNNLITQFLGQGSNKSIAAQENAREIAAETIQSNAKQMLQMQKTVQEVSKTINDSKLGKRLTGDQKAQLTYQLAMKDNWKSRVAEMEKEITGNSEVSTTYSAAAEYGSKKSWERKQKAQEKAVEDTATEIEALQQELQKVEAKQATAKRKRKNLYNNKIESLKLQITAAKERKTEAENKLKQINDDASLFVDNEGKELTHSTQVLSKDEILSLNPQQRAWMLNEHNLSDYSPAQQQVIKETITELKQQNPDVMETIQDVDALHEMVKANDAAYAKLTDEKNAVAAASWAQSMLESRDKAMNRVWKAKAQQMTDDIMNQAMAEDEKNGTTSEATSLKKAARSIGYEALSDYIERTTNSFTLKPGVPIREDGNYAEEDWMPNPEAHLLYDTAQVLKLQSDAVSAINTLFADDNQAGVRAALSQAIYGFTAESNNVTEAMSAIEDAIDAQTSEVAKNQLEAVVAKMEELSYQRDATKVVNREELAKKAQEEAAKKDGNNYGWNGYKVGDTVFNETRGKGTIVSFGLNGDKKTQMTVKFEESTPVSPEMQDTTSDTYTFNSEHDKGIITKDTPMDVPDTGKAPKDMSKAEQQSAEDVDLGLEKPSTKPATEVPDSGVNPAQMQETTEAPKNTATTETTSVEEGETSETLNQPTGEGAQFISAEDVPLESTPQGDVAKTPSIEEQAKKQLEQLVVEVQIISTQDLTEQGNRYNNNSADLLAGTLRMGYDAKELEATGKQKQRVGAQENDSMNQFNKWLEETSTKLQDIIDNELGRIIANDPETKIHFLQIKPEQGSSLQKEMIEVIEYTPKVKKFHDEANGGIITSNGKQWLVVGVLGYTNVAQRNNYNAVQHSVQVARKAYFDANPSERYYVDPAFYTNFDSGTSGYVTRQLVTDEGVEIRKVGDLADGKKSARNPEGLSLDELKWGIQQGDKFVTIGVTDRNTVYPPKDRQGNSGNVFLLVKAANGNYIPIYVKPVMLNELVQGSELKNQIDTLINDLTSPSYDDRVTAIRQLVQMLNLTETDNILIGDRKHNTVSIKQNGNITRTFVLDANFNRAEFLKAINEANFRVNITTSVLQNPTAIKMYNDAGALITDAAKLGTSNMVYSVYPCGKDGKPIITENASWNNSPNRPSNGELSKKYTHSVLYQGKTYRERDGIFYDEVDKPVDKESKLYEQLYWNQYVQVNQLEPSTTDKGFDYYVIRNSVDDPLVIKRDKRGNIKIADAETSRKTIEVLQRRAENESRAQAAEAEVAIIDAEDAARINAQMDAINNGTAVEMADESIMPNQMLTQEQLAQQFTGKFDGGTQTTTPTVTEKQAEEEVKPVPQPKKDVNEVGNGLLRPLQGSGEITTFAAAYKNSTYRAQLKEIIKEKGWTDFPKSLKDMVDYLHKKNIATEGITDIEGWLQMIKDCK